MAPGAGAAASGRGAGSRGVVSAGSAAGTSAGGGEGGASEVAGAASVAAGGGSGGMSAAPSDDGAYTISMCPGATPREMLDPSLPLCDGAIRCGEDAHCVPSERLSERRRSRTPDCSKGKCIPDRLARADRFSFKRCTGDAGEGVCIPQCFALAVNPLSVVFTRGGSGCGSEEVCAPCSSPLDGISTGACDDACEDAPND